MTFDLWPADSKFELDLYFSVIYLHIKNIQNPSNIFEVIVRKPIWIYNELWPLTFDLRTPNSNLTCILVSSTYISKISKIRPRFLKLLCGNQFGGRTDGRTGATHNAPSRLRLRGHKKTIQNIWDNRMINARRPCDGRKWLQECPILNVGNHTNAAYTPQVIAGLPAAYDRHFCDNLRSTEDICRINCVHRTDVVRLLAISGISVVKWSHSVTKNTACTTFLRSVATTCRNPP